MSVGRSLGDGSGIEEEENSPVTCLAPNKAPSQGTTEGGSVLVSKVLVELISMISQFIPGVRISPVWTALKKLDKDQHVRKPKTAKGPTGGEIRGGGSNTSDAEARCERRVQRDVHKK